MVSTQAITSSNLNSLKPLGYWMFGLAGMVYGMVVLGGVTRLTRSGLSMVEWKPQGSLPPLSEEEWNIEFNKYKQYPEYKIMNQGMTLDEFKYIYLMEWSHRMWGRLIGFAFAVPCVYFAARGLIPKPLYGRLALLFGLGGSQGMIGWWMVKSGLEEPQDRTVPRVSPYRLATHLISAFAIYSMLLKTGFDLISPAPVVTQSIIKSLPIVGKLRVLSLVSATLIGITAFSGAFVAGNDAGHAFNDWPFMAGRWVPEGILEMQPTIRNFFENSATVQFDHRLLAYTTLISTSVLYALAKRPDVWKQLPKQVRASIGSMGGMALLQLLLGISTLIMYVPTSLAATHQVSFIFPF